MKEIIIHNFTVKRGSFTLYPLSLTIEKGEIFAILGRTGSGKTVLLEAIEGMFPGTGGSVLYDGIDVMEIPPFNRRLGFVYQDHGLFPHMKVYDNIVYGLKMHGFTRAEQEERAYALMEMLSITHIRNQYPGTLSGEKASAPRWPGRWPLNRKSFFWTNHSQPWTRLPGSSFTWNLKKYMNVFNVP